LNNKLTVEIPQEIAEDEILVRYLFSSDFKKKNIDLSLIDDRNIFLPYKGGVSMQRNFYCDENDCKKRAKNIPKDYVGFVVFRKLSFEEVKAEYIENERPEFEAEIKATPMDDNSEYLQRWTILYPNSNGNPAHSDLEYKNPAPKPEENPNTAIRSFSRKLSRKTKVIIDQNPEKDIFIDCSFSKVV